MNQIKLKQIKTSFLIQWIIFFNELNIIQMNQIKLKQIETSFLIHRIVFFNELNYKSIQMNQNKLK